MANQNNNSHANKNKQKETDALLDIKWNGTESIGVLQKEEKKKVVIETDDDVEKDLNAADVDENEEDYAEDD